MPERIFVTGGSGFVGRYLTSMLRCRFPRAELTSVGLDVSPDSKDNGVLRVDLAKADQVLSAVAAARPDLVIHLAAQSSQSQSDMVPVETWHTNLVGSLNLALAVARDAPEATVLFVSSSAVYGTNLINSPVDEETPTAPLNAYAKSKLLAERVFDDVLPPSARLIVARPFNHTGVGQRDHFVLPSFAKQIAEIEAGLVTPTLHVGNIDVRRDFLDVKDVVEGYLALATTPGLPRRLIVNVASGRPRSLRELLNVFQGLAKSSFDIAADPERRRPVEVPVAYAVPTLLTQLTGWRPQYAIEDTLQALLDDLRSELINRQVVTMNDLAQGR